MADTDYANLIRIEPNAAIMREEIADGIEQATNYASNAVNTAENANNTANNTNSRVDEIIAHGTDGSLEELVDVRNRGDGTAATSAGDRVRELGSQLADMAKDINLYKSKQSIELAKLIDINVNNRTIVVNCQGDSWTVGKQVGTVCYPDVLSNILNELTGSKATIINRGYGGDTVADSYGRWTTNPNANVHIVMFGFNDAYKGKTMEQSINDYFTLIKQLLDWGGAVIILTPSAKQYYGADIMAFNSMTKRLAQMLNIPCFDTTEMVEGYNINDIGAGDTVHLNDTGYTILASKIATIFMGSAVLTPNIFKLRRGKHISMNPWNGNMRINNLTDIGSKLAYASASLFGSADAYNNGLSCELSQNDQLNIAFYSEEDDLVLAPYFSATSGAQCTTYLNYRAVQPKQITTIVDSQSSFANTSTLSNNLIFTKGGNQNAYKTTNPYIRLSSRGLNNIYVKNTGDSGSTLHFYGFYVMSYKDYLDNKKIEYEGKVTPTALTGSVTFPNAFPTTTKSLFLQVEQYQATDGVVTEYNFNNTGFSYTVNKLGFSFLYRAKGE